MKIILDAAVSGPTPAGLEVWCRKLLEALAGVDQENQYLVWGAFWRDFSKRRKRIYLPAAPNFRLKVWRMPRRLATGLEDRGRPLLETGLAADQADIFHGLRYFLPRLRRLKGVATIYDLSFVINPGWYQDAWYRNVPLYCRRADAIAAISRTTADDLVKHFGLPAKKIEVIYGGVGRPFRPESDRNRLEAFRREQGLERPFLLTVATSDRRKNLAGLLEAFGLAAERIPELELVIAGNPAAVQPPLRERINRLGLADRIRFPGYLPTTDLVRLYNLALAFVFPSFYEGFGLPVLEAMACGTP
ncbi:MAG TPA: glycosyltransferase family 1 protein, partial [bacterium]|nr:glycosyltransferase family 1 protein [bacterium]